MQRRRFLSGLAATPPLLLLGACADQEIPRRVVYASGFSMPKSIDEALWLEFEARAERLLPDNDVRLLIRGETGPEETSFSALRRGRLQIVGGSFAGVATLVPEIALLSLPFFFDSIEEVDFVMDRYMLEPFRELFAAKGLRVLHWTDIGWVSLYSKASLQRPDQARGVRVRASTSIASQAFIAEVGADMVTMPFSEVLPALQTGLIDAGVTSVTMYSLSGITKVAPHYTLTRHSYDMGVAMASEKWFQTLSDEEQAVYSQGLGDVVDARRRARASVEVLLGKLYEQGVQIHDPSAEEREVWRAAARPSYEKLIRQIGGASRRIYETLLEGRDAWRRSNA